MESKPLSPSAVGISPRRPLPPPPPVAWGSLGEPLLLLVVGHLTRTELAAVHLVSKAWRDTARLSTRVLHLSGQAPDTGRIKEAFPHVAELSLSRMRLGPSQMACIAGLTRLTALQLRVCSLSDGASILVLRNLGRLRDLHLCEVLGPTAEALDEAIAGLSGLHSLHVESLSPACKAPSLCSLALLPGMRKLSVKQSRPWQGLSGLTNLEGLHNLQALDLRGAAVTNAIMHRLSELTALTQLRMPEASLVTDVGFEALEGLTSLCELDLSCTRLQLDGPVTDGGVSYLSGMCQLTSLSLAGRSLVTAGGLAFLAECTGLQHLDLSCVWMSNGDATWLWQLTNLTQLRMGGRQVPAAQFSGLSALLKLTVLDVHSTLFDDGYCAQLEPLTRLRDINLAHTRVTTAGVQLLNDWHAGRLERLRLDGCSVSMRTVLRTLCRQPGVRLWSDRLRGHMPRWTNAVNALLMTASASGMRRFRLHYTPESSWGQQAAMVGLTAGILLAYILLLLGTLTVLLLLPVAGFFTACAGLLLYAAGRRVSQRPIMAAAARGEVLLSAVLVGVLSVHVPPPPPVMHHEWY